MSKNTEFAEKLAELVVREAERRTDGYIKPEIVREVWQEHIDEQSIPRTRLRVVAPTARTASGSSDRLGKSSAPILLA